MMASIMLDAGLAKGINGNFAGPNTFVQFDPLRKWKWRHWGLAVGWFLLGGGWLRRGKGPKCLEANLRLFLLQMQIIGIIKNEPKIGGNYLNI
jgi:hypothetical protein